MSAIWQIGLHEMVWSQIAYKLWSINSEFGSVTAFGGKVGTRLFAWTWPSVSSLQGTKDGKKSLGSASAALVKGARVPLPRCIWGLAQNVGREGTGCVYQILR